MNQKPSQDTIGQELDRRPVTIAELTAMAKSYTEAFPGQCAETVFINGFLKGYMKAVDEKRDAE